MQSMIFILAGGSGTRLAPLSLTLPGKLPKQFLALVGSKTMLQEAVERIPQGTVVIVPEEKYADEVRKQCGKNIDVLPEPFGCNTAAAIGLSARYALRKNRDPEQVLFFMPADHIMDKKEFEKIFNVAVNAAQTTDKIITIGIKPDRPETGYGYIKTKGITSVNNHQLCDVDCFVEKPDHTTAQKYLADGGYFWNAGIFTMKVKTILHALETDAPVIFQKISNINFDHNLSAEITREYAALKSVKQNISIDYAVMEKEAQNMLLIPADEKLEWNDVGGWVALAKYNPPDDYNNLVLNYLKKEINFINCRDLLIVTSENGILITSQDQAQSAKEIISGIESGKTVDLIACQYTEIQNTTKEYVGVIGLNGYLVSYDGKTLSIQKK